MQCHSHLIRHRAVRLAQLFLRSAQTTNKSTTAQSKTSHNKSPLTATQNITAFIVRNSCVSTAVAYDFIHGPVDLVTVFDAILTSRQTREKLQCLYENLMSNNFRITAFLKKI